MATIHLFRPAPRSETTVHLGGAEIIIFPGVRYEYWDATPSGPKRKPKSRKAKRKRAAR